MADPQSTAIPLSRRGLWACLAASLLFLALGLWSCSTTSAGDEYSLTLKLDSSRVGKFDSVRVEIYNGSAPKAGDTTKPVQTEVIKVSPTTKEVTVTLDGKVGRDFSVVVTGFKGDDIAYRNLHNVEGFTSPDTSKHSILLITSIKAEDLTLSVGETRYPSLTITPNDAVDKKVKFSVAETGVAIAVDDSLKGVAVGKTKAKAISPDGAISVEFGITVVAVRVVSVLADTALSLKVGDSVTAAVAILPDNATDKEYVLVSFDSLVARTNGHAIIALKAGDTKIEVSSRDGGAADTIPLSVRLAVTGLKASAMTKEVGDRFVPVLEFAPAGATNKRYALSTPDTALVRVFGDSIEAKAVGIARVTATSEDGAFAAPFDVTVAKKVFRVKGVDAAALRGLVGDTLTPKLTFDPANASDQGFTLAAIDTALVATANGKVIAKALGSAKVEVITVDGALKDTFTVSVEASNFNADIKPITSSKCAGCHIPPSRLDWTDSAIFVRHGAIAINRLKLPESDSLHMPLPGAVGGPITARELKVLLAWLARVVVPLQNAAIGDTTVNLGDTITLAIKYTPADASNKFYTLAVPDTAVTVVRGGSLMPIATGKVTVSATMEDGGKKVDFVLTVKPPEYEKNVRPIVSIKCAPCHFGPNATYNWQDSSALISDGTEAIRRLSLPVGTKGHMPFAADSAGPPNGELSAQQLRVLLGWLHAKVVPLTGITVAADSVQLGASKAPNIVFIPANASNKTYTVESADSTKVDIDEGKMVGKALGTATMHVVALDGGFSKFFNLTVIPVPVDSIVAHDSAGAIGDTVIPKVDFFPANATTKTFTIALINASTRIQVAAGNKIVGIALGKDSVLARSLADTSKKSKLYYTVGPVVPKSLSVADTNGVVSGALIKPRLTWVPATTTDKRFLLSVTAGDTLTIAAARDSLMLPRTAAGQVTVKATSIADASVTATFKFTVGTVPVQSISISNTPVQLAIGSSLFPTVVFNPTNATTKTYTLSLSTGAAGNLTLAAGNQSVTANHLAAATLIATSTDGAKTANWSITVIRPPMGTANKTLIQNRCSGCHFTGNLSGIPPWWDSVNSKVDSALIVIQANSDKIINRVSVLKDMPPSGTALTPTEISTLVNWLNTK